MKRVRWLTIAISIVIILTGTAMWGMYHAKQQDEAATASTKVASATSKVKSAKKVPVVKKAARPGWLTQQQAIKRIDQLVNQHHIMGTLLITTNGPKNVKVRTYGYADASDQVRNTATEAYPLASLQKAITGALIQNLINEGKISMTTPLSKFYPEIPYANQITIRELLNHTSGMRMDETTPKSTLPNEKAQIAFTIKNAVSTGNHAYKYTNANFTLLAGVIRKVTHKSYMTALQNDIIKPLGLKHTYAYNAIPGNEVNPVSYRLSNGEAQGAIISKPLQSSELGCGSLYMSVGDYYKFMYSLQSGDLLSDAGIAELSDHFQIRYAAGIYYQKGNTIRIGGNDNAFHTYYMGTRDARVGVALFENQGDFSNDNQVATSIRNILMKTENY